MNGTRPAYGSMKLTTRRIGPSSQTVASYCAKGRHRATWEECRGLSIDESSSDFACTYRHESQVCGALRFTEYVSANQPKQSLTSRLVIHISGFHLIPDVFIVLHCLRAESSRPRDRGKALSVVLKFLQPLRRGWTTPIDTINLDPVTRARHMQSPIPRLLHSHRLRIQAIVPAAHNKFCPSLVVAGNICSEGTPRPFMLCGELFVGNWIPYVTAVRGDFYSFRPAATT